MLSNVWLLRLVKVFSKPVGFKSRGSWIRAQGRKIVSETSIEGRHEKGPTVKSKKEKSPIVEKTS